MAKCKGNVGFAHTFCYKYVKKQMWEKERVSCRRTIVVHIKKIREVDQGQNRQQNRLQSRRPEEFQNQAIPIIPMVEKQSNNCRRNRQGEMKSIYLSALQSAHFSLLVILDGVA